MYGFRGFGKRHEPRFGGGSHPQRRNGWGVMRPVLGWGRNKLNTDRDIELDLFPGLLHAAGRAIKLEHDYVVRILVSHQEVRPGGIDGEVARHDGSAGRLLDQGKRALLRIDGKYADGVGTPPSSPVLRRLDS